MGFFMVSDGKYKVYHLSENVGFGKEQKIVFIESPDRISYGFFNCPVTEEYFPATNLQIAIMSELMSEQKVEPVIVDEEPGRSLLDKLATDFPTREGEAVLFSEFTAGIDALLEMIQK